MAMTAYEKCHLWYVEKKMWTDGMLAQLVEKGKITQEQMDTLVAERATNEK